MSLRRTPLSIPIALLLSCVSLSAPASAQTETFDQREIVAKATGFFGDVSEGLARAIEKAFRDLGAPNAYIAGEEAGGAFMVGLRFGQGDLHFKKGGSRTVFWNGPSIGWDIGGSASKVFILVYRLPDTQRLFQRFPGVEGSLFFVAGVGMNYVQSGSIVLAPIRTGVGLRAGINAGYLSFTPRRSWVPF